ncbi:BTAD domain-containing putative transcriptional regulator [Amorphoplanes digitatis]|uniref:DNA-binding SARP family transcriptional activator n=1 Tax=Actinoplanes digitatis TaxID=1868 RepID=A0A7W7MTH9_9ACTN|nr:BTAD domain-containing putative transcriptional regulator [Actinoplanes digitatis]MBB4765800.1 DNA-binding SARP family transcriptional activator [Actinoplanes digitatis]
MGRFVVVRDGREVDESAYQGRKVRTLLRVLATRQGRFVPNDLLIAALWPQRPPADPAANLQVLVNRARRAVGRPALIHTGPQGYALSGPPGCVVDTEVFLSAVERAGGLDGRAALSAYRDALGPAAEPLPEDLYADWSQPYRTRVLQARQIAWERAAALAAALGAPAPAVEYATAAATAEPLRETAALALVRALAASGDRVAALACFDRYRHSLADELGLDPSPAAAELHRLLLRSDPVRDEPRAGFGMLPFVGRDAVVRQVVAGLPDGVVRIAGRSGTGKSRLLEEVAAAVPAVGVAASWADRDEPWSLARTLLRRLLAADTTALGTLPGRLRAALAELLPELDPPPAGFDPETRNALVLEAARRLLTAHPERALLVDDLQWADPSSVQLLGSVAGGAARPRLVLAYRPDELPAGPAELVRRSAGPPVIELGGLREFALADLVDDADLVAALAAETDRTPMAVAEVLRLLHSEGLLEAADAAGRRRAASPEAAGRARQAGRAGQRRAIADRAAAHAGRAATVLGLLALLGREVPAQTLAAAAELSHPDLLGPLEELAAANLVRLGDHGWRTAHDMVAEVVVDGLTDATRARLHARLATVLDVAHGDAPEQARHWLGAGDVTRAAEAYARAAANALDQVADAEAGQLADAGLATGGADGPVRARLLAARAQARRRRGDIAAARDDLRAALAGYPGGPARAGVLAQLAALDSGADDMRRAAEVAELALIEAGADDRARAAVLEVAAVIDMNLDQPGRSAARAAEALAIYTRTGDSRGAARILDARAMAAFLHGSIEEGVDELDRAAHLFESSGDLMRTVTPRSTCGHGRVLLDRAAEGLADTERALDVARTLGHPDGETYALWHRSEALSALGRPDDALADGREALAIAQRLNHRGWTATAWRATGIAYQMKGDLPAALDAFHHSLDLCANLDLFGCWAASRAALICVDLNRLAEADHLITRALATGPALGRHEARWATAALSVARRDPAAPTLLATAVEAASSAGARLYLPYLAELTRRLETPG